MSAITAAAHRRLVLLRMAMDASERLGHRLVHREDSMRYRDAVTLLSLQTGQSYEAIDADAREEART